MSRLYEVLAVSFMVMAFWYAWVRPQDGTFAAGLSIAMGTLALVHEHRASAKSERDRSEYRVSIDSLMDGPEIGTRGL